MPVSDDSITAAVDAIFIAIASCGQVHPRATKIEDATRALATSVKRFHDDTGVAIPPEVQAELDWALDPERDAETGQRGNRP